MLDIRNIQANCLVLAPFPTPNFCFSGRSRAPLAPRVVLSTRPCRIHAKDLDGDGVQVRRSIYSARLYAHLYNAQPTKRMTRAEKNFHR